MTSPTRNGLEASARRERGLQRGHLEPQVPAPQDEVVGVRAALEQQVTRRCPRFEVTFQSRVLPDRGQRFGTLGLDQMLHQRMPTLPPTLGFVASRSATVDGKGSSSRNTSRSSSPGALVEDDWAILLRSNRN